MKQQRTASKWRLLSARPGDGATNMARDAALMDRARQTGETVFSVYSWKRPTLSFGRNQQALGRYNQTAIDNANLDVVRRPTGGRALLHDHEITYSVTAPIGSEESLRESYRRINRVLLYALRSLGVDASESRAPVAHLPPGTAPCFAEAAEGELVVRGAKLVGSAQFRESGALLQHGSILLRDDQVFIKSLLVAPDEPNFDRAATLTESMGRQPALTEVTDALFGAVVALEDSSAMTLNEGELGDAVVAHRHRFVDRLWTWRR
ncbi:MAG: hypothetical protein ABIS03_04335 [Gemmatimonadaceae bacterium]